MAILVTGAAGFIGFHVVNTLIGRGETVIGIDNLNDYYQVQLKRDRIAASQALGGDYVFEQIDFSEHQPLEAFLEGREFDRIIHLGAQAGVRYSLTNPRAYVASNLAGHVNILELARHRKVAHLVYASSSSVYGGNESLPFKVEDRVDHPLSLYAATKKADELMSDTYAHLYRIPQTGLRFFTVYGPWGRPDMAMWIFTSKILAGEPIPVFNHGRMLRDFTYIDDIVRGVIAALDHPPPPNEDGRRYRLYNIGNNQPEPLLRLIEVLEAAIGKPAQKRLQPMQPGDVRATYADIEDIRRDLGFEPTTPIDMGVPKFVDWFRNYYGRNLP